MTRIGSLLVAAGVLTLMPQTVIAQSFNEIRTDQESTDVDEYVELKGVPNASLDGLSIVVIGDGTRANPDDPPNSGVIEEVIRLDGQSLDDNGYWVAVESSFTLGNPADFFLADLEFENKDNVTFFLVRGLVAANRDDLDDNDNGILDYDDSPPGTAPWTTIVDRIAILEEHNPPQQEDGEFHYGPPFVGPDGEFAPGHVIKCPDGWIVGEFVSGILDTPGADNNCDDEPLPEGDAGPIGEEDAGPDVPDAGPGMDIDASIVPIPGNATRRDRPGVFCQVGAADLAGGWLVILGAIGLVAYGRRRRRG